MFKFSYLSALTLGLAALECIAAAKISNQTPAFDRDLSHVFRRQVPGIPAQCENTCGPVNVLINGRCSPQGCCTQSFAQSFYDCYVCAAQAYGQNDYTQAQEVFDSIIETCASSGFLIQVLTFPGQNPSRTLSSFALGPTNSGQTFSLPTGSVSINPPKTPVGGSTSKSISILTSNTQATPTSIGAITSSGSGSSTGTAPGSSTTSSGKQTNHISLSLFAGALLGVGFTLTPW